MNSRIFALITTLLVAGCAQSPEIKPTPYIAPPKSDLSTLVIYRMNAMPTGVYARVHVDGALMATLPDRMHTWHQVPAGSHTITIKFPVLSGVKEAIASVVVEPGKAYYLQYEGGAPNSRIPMYGPGGTLIGSMDGGGSFWNRLTIIENDRAEQAIKSLGLQFTPGANAQP